MKSLDLLNVKFFYCIKIVVETGDIVFVTEDEAIFLAKLPQLLKGQRDAGVKVLKYMTGGCEATSAEIARSKVINGTWDVVVRQMC